MRAVNAELTLGPYPSLEPMFFDCSQLHFPKRDAVPTPPWQSPLPLPWHLGPHGAFCRAAGSAPGPGPGHSCSPSPPTEAKGGKDSMLSTGSRPQPPGTNYWGSKGQVEALGLPARTTSSRGAREPRACAPSCPDPQPLAPSQPLLSWASTFFWIQASARSTL